MAKKLYDLAVKTGEYMDGAGLIKGRWTNVGAVVQQDDGGKFLLIDPHFNFAAVQRAPGKDRVAVSMFAPDQPQAQGFVQQQVKDQLQAAQMPVATAAQYARASGGSTARPQAQGPQAMYPNADDVPF